MTIKPKPIVKRKLSYFEDQGSGLKKYPLLRAVYFDDTEIRFVEDGLFGEVPEPFQFYIDYEAIARDLAVDYGETVIAGNRLIYRCG